MSQDITLKVPTLSRLPAMLKAAKELGAARVEVTAGGVWVEVKHGKHGDLVFRISRVVRPLKGGKRLLALVDGQTITIEPWFDTMSNKFDYWMYLKLVF